MHATPGIENIWVVSKTKQTKTQNEVFAEVWPWSSDMKRDEKNRPSASWPRVRVFLFLLWYETPKNVPKRHFLWLRALWLSTNTFRAENILICSTVRCETASKTFTAQTLLRVHSLRKAHIKIHIKRRVVYQFGHHLHEFEQRGFPVSPLQAHHTHIFDFRLYYNVLRFAFLKHHFELKLLAISRAAGLTWSTWVPRILNFRQFSTLLGRETISY